MQCPPTRRKNDTGQVEVLCCPTTNRSTEGSDVLGCGSHRVTWNTREGLFDCKCGIWFEPQEGEWKPLTSYHFNLGDSTKLGVGLCARVDATSPEDALVILNAAVPEETQLMNTLGLSRAADHVEYINLYVDFEDITVEHIDHQELVTEE